MGINYVTGELDSTPDATPASPVVSSAPAGKINYVTGELDTPSAPIATQQPIQHDPIAVQSALESTPKPQPNGTSQQPFTINVGQNKPSVAPVAPATSESTSPEGVSKIPVAYDKFNSRLNDLVADTSSGTLSGIGGILGSLSSIGKWFSEPIDKAVTKITGKPSGTSENYGDTVKEFADEVDQHLAPKDKTYLDNVFKGLGTAIPYIAGGAIAEGAKIPALVSSIGIGGVQALDTARTDYHELVSSGDKNAPEKAAGVFAIDWALNTAAHFLGPLAQGGSNGILPSIGRVLKSSLLETANYGFAQTVASNITTGQAPMKGVWDAVLTMAPVSLAIGGVGEAGHANAEKQVNDVVKTTAEKGGTIHDATEILSKLSDVPESKVQEKVNDIVSKDETIQNKFDENNNASLDDLATTVQAQNPVEETTVKNPEVETPPSEEPPLPPASQTVEEKPIEQPAAEESKPAVESPIEPEGNKVSKAALDANKRLVEKGFDNIPEEEQAKFASSEGKRKEQIENIAKLITEDPEKAKQIVLGNEPLPENVPGPILYNSMLEWADKHGDYAFIRDAAGSKIGRELSESASNVESAKYGRGEKGKDSPAQQTAKAIKEISDSRQEQSEKKNKNKNTTPDKEAKKIKEKGDKIVKDKMTAKKPFPKLEEFIQSITC